MLKILKILTSFCLCHSPLQICHNNFETFNLDQMSLEEKVGQLLLVHFHGETTNEDARVLIQDVGVGGIIYYNWANGLHSPRQVQSLSFSLQELTKSNGLSIPLFIAADQEGGAVARLRNGFTVFPGNRALGETHDPHLAEIAALAMGLELRAVGVNMNFAPVVDVNSNPRNPIIGIRSFGDNPETVTAFGAKALQGFKQANIMATLKHFPGHGDVEIDSHEDLPVIHKSMEDLEKIELLPFSELAASADLIMTAHILVPAFDKENCATLSEKTLNFLKDKMGFQGVIITDSLVMESILKKCSTVDEAAIQALKAGCDLLLLGGKQLLGTHANLELTVNDIRRIQVSIMDAIKSGRLSEDRLNQSIKKILKLKERYLSSETLSPPADLFPLIHSPNHQKIAKDIASLALTIISHEPGPISSLSTKKMALFAPQFLRDNLSPLLQIGKTSDLFLFEDLYQSPEAMERAMQQAMAADVLQVCSYNTWKSPSQSALIHSLQNMGKPTILLVMGDPLDASLFPKANLIFKTFSPTPPAIEVVCNQLKSY
jgi:beta-N-acetylhexosaminidase